jgi:methyl-accepting chemotaxis protein
MGYLLSIMRLFSIRLRMVSAIGVVLLLLGVVGASGLWGMSKLESLSERFTRQSFAASMAMADLRVALADLKIHEKAMIIQYEKPTEIAVLEGKWYVAAAQVDKRMAAILVEAPDNAAARELQASVKAYVQAAESVIAQLKTGAFDTATVANLRLVKAHQQMDQAETMAQKLTQMVAAEAEAVRGEQQAAAQQALWLFGVAVAVAMLVVVPTTLANMQSICQPIGQAQRFAQAIAGGDLTGRVNATGNDEVATLLRAQTDMQTAIARIVRNMHEVADSMRGASAEIATGNHDLSARTEHAASSLEETASSLHELTAMVRQTADAAARASSSAQTNALAAQQGGDAMAQVVVTMEAIAGSSQKINDIIGVIDGIAFQTNILALNAAVEAARAGEAGRGFAVVASEVRNLAQRSAEAAREIKTLITHSVEKVQAGTQQVQQAGQTMSGVVANAREVSDLIGEITRSATEQSQGIEVINVSVSELDTMTQQNAALVVQSTSAVSGLREQAERLAQAVSVFRLSA